VKEQRLRVLRAYFPGSVETHSLVQNFYFGDDLMLRRHDYNVNIAFVNCKEEPVVLTGIQTYCRIYSPSLGHSKAMGPHGRLCSAKPSFPFREDTIYTICVDCNVFGENQPRISETSYLTANFAKMDLLVCFGSCLFQISPLVVLMLPGPVFII
jgi:hypothetical protein